MAEQLKEEPILAAEMVQKAGTGHTAPLRQFLQSKAVIATFPDDALGLLEYELAALQTILAVADPLRWSVHHTPLLTY